METTKVLIFGKFISNLGNLVSQIHNNVSIFGELFVSEYYKNDTWNTKCPKLNLAYIRYSTDYLWVLNYIYTYGE